MYNVPDALDPEAPMDASVFLNGMLISTTSIAIELELILLPRPIKIDNRTRAAIHAPTSKNWQSSINYNFSGPHGNDPSTFILLRSPILWKDR